MAYRLKSLIITTGMTAALLLGATACRAEAMPAGPASVANAQPCSGPSPVAGVDIRGPVLHVIDGQTLCVALGFEKDSWIKLRLVDGVQPRVNKTSNAREAAPDPRGALMQVALAKMADCRTVTGDDGQVEAVCTIDGRPIGDQLREPGVVAASYEWR